MHALDVRPRLWEGVFWVSHVLGTSFNECKPSQLVISCSHQDMDKGPLISGVEVLRSMKQCTPGLIYGLS